MNIEEFGAISARFNWGECPSPEMWVDIEDPYMNTPVEFSKELVAFLYWMKTGRFERLVDKMKQVREICEKIAGGCKWMIGDLTKQVKEFDALVKTTAEEFTVMEAK